MTRYYSTGTRDANEKEFIELLKAANVRFLQLDKNHGADLLILVHPIEFWEIKNPEYELRLTEKEIDLQEYCKLEGIDYLVFDDVEVAAERISYLNDRHSSR